MSIERNLNSIKCACNNPNCKIGIHFDEEPNVMLIHDKNGNLTAMSLNKENVNKLIIELLEIKF